MHKLFKYLIPAICAYFIFTLSYSSKVKYTNSDPQLTLLTSLALLENGSIDLYNYFQKNHPDSFSDGTWKYSYWKNEKKVYYIYPLGTSFLSIPFVAIAKYCGYDLSSKQDDAIVQSFISSCCVVIIFLLLFAISINYLPFYLSLFTSILFVLGTTIISSIGTALWSFNYETIFLLLIAIHIQNHFSKQQKLNGILLGIYVFMAWFCRPSALVFSLILGLALLLYDIKCAFKYGGTLLVLFIPVAYFSLKNFNLIVPIYYHPLFWTHMTSDDSFVNKFFAVLFSPARGLFIYSPFLLVSFIGLFYKSLRKNVLYVFSLSWFVLHTLMLARQANWWGGWCYGPRLFTDALVPLALMFVLSLTKVSIKNTSTFILLIFIFLGIYSTYSHSVQGINNKYSVKWNDNPQIDYHTDFYTWNWDYPQFCADSIANLKKKNEFNILTRIDKGYLKLPKGAVVVVKNDNDFVRDIVSKINQDRIFKDILITTNKDDIHRYTNNSFYITPDLYDDFKNNLSYTSQVSTHAITLADYLKKNKEHHIFLVTKFDIFKNMSVETKKYLDSTGALLTKLYVGEGYALHLFNGKKIEETRMINHLPAELNTKLNGSSIDLLSDGYSKASIKVNQKEFSYMDGGINVVCVNELGKVVDRARFNTYYADVEYMYLFRFELYN
ncbi:MAG: hypothetical protein J0M08_11670 [Bacteroidetes bacterium]|nr:hypothetical protein [Bacteroidota bacterium]